MEGNQMKMRDALEGLARSVRAFMATKGANFYPDVAIALEAANAALSAPARNCDLPNPEERYIEFCSRYKSCSTCQHDRTLNGLRCDGKWLLAPAEKGGAE